MKKYALMLLAIAGILALPLVGCNNNSGSEDSMSQMIPGTFVYAGNTYISTSIEVAHQELDADPPSKVMFLASSSQQGGEYEIYMIEGSDTDEAIALKIGVGGSYSYFRYEMLYGQEEPPTIVYQGTEYRSTGQIADIERVDAETGAPETLEHLDSIVYNGTSLDVYSIQGVDENQVVALRIAKAGKIVGFLYCYLQYERL